ncbi:MAG TPA: hypothetical protein VMZ49_05545 [Patescibacteria group bacterium]|nr:hypothetical protein [Patescibacteria group bacterium]
MGSKKSSAISVINVLQPAKEFCFIDSSCAFFFITKIFKVVYTSAVSKKLSVGGRPASAGKKDDEGDFFEIFQILYPLATEIIEDFFNLFYPLLRTGSGS